jgi:hypothetical protein
MMSTDRLNVENDLCQENFMADPRVCKPGSNTSYKDKPLKLKEARLSPTL